MPQAPTLSPELTRQAVSLARALAIAIRHWSLYPPDHPSVAGSVGRLADAVRDSVGGVACAFGVTPSTLLVAGLPLPDEAPVAETARLLHDRDILEISFLGVPPTKALEDLLRLLATSADNLRAAGGPEQVWAARGHGTIAIRQIDYQKILEDPEIARPPERRDDLWRSLVNAIVQGRQEFDEVQQHRLLEISRSSADIGKLARDVIEPKRNLDGSPLITTQAATILAVFRHITGIVQVMEPDRLPEVLQNVAAATATLDPHVVAELLQTEEGLQQTPIIGRIAAAFDDEAVAKLLAAALTRDGRATARLAQVFDTIAPDENRKRRVLTLARSMLTEHDFGKSGQFRVVWESMETLLLGYDERPYVSASYQAALNGAGARGAMLAVRDLPVELPAWLESVAQENVRSLSVLLVTDLLRLETHPDRAAEIALDMVALVDDLLLAGDFTNARVVLRELRAASRGRIAAAAAEAALASVADSSALRDAAAMLDDLDEAVCAAFGDCCEAIGPAAVKALYPALQSETETRKWARARDIVRRYGAAAAIHLAGLAADKRWFVQRNAAILLGATRSPDAVPVLQALLRQNDPRVMRHAVAALAAIDDPSAARAVQTALRAASGDARLAVVEALGAERDPRVVPMLARVLAETDPFGPDHHVVLDALDALARLADERAVPSIVAVMRRRKLFSGRKARAFKAASVKALVAIGTARARAALDDAAQTGDRVLKRAVREARG
jgi:HEAT repeat protein